MESHLYNASDVLKSDSAVHIDEKSDESFFRLMRYLISCSVFLIAILAIFLIVCLIKRGQKTRNPQQRRGCLGPRAVPSLTPADPTIFVSPANLPPPPKYEAMAPPSYEEVVGIHYPGYRPPVQPITQPLTTAMAHHATTGNSSNSTNNNNETSAPVPSTVITVTTDDRHTSVNVAT